MRLKIYQVPCKQLRKTRPSARLFLPRLSTFTFRLMQGREDLISALSTRSYLLQRFNPSLLSPLLHIFYFLNVGIWTRFSSIHVSAVFVVVRPQVSLLPSLRSRRPKRQRMAQTPSKRHDHHSPLRQRPQSDYQLCQRRHACHQCHQCGRRRQD